MEEKYILLHQPPFTPADDQVIYMEWQPDKSLNAFIRKHYEWLKSLFLSHDLQFCYLPLLGKEVIKYNAPHLTEADCEKILASLPSLQDCVVKDDNIQGPVLAFSTEQEDSREGVYNTLHYVEINNKWFRPTKAIFKQLVEEIVAERKKAEANLYRNEIADDKKIVEEPSIRFSTVPIGDADNEPETKPQKLEFRYSLKDREADETFEEEAKKLIQEIKDRIDALQNRGVNTMFLHNIIDGNNKLSRLVITKEFRILLPDFNNTEIEIAALPKAVFLLYLKHPEGIRFKELPDYYAELLQIYLKLNPMGTRQKQENSISDVTNPFKNSINEKCARIREAFISKFDDRLAQNYYITGKKGEPKKITIDNSMIIWE